MYHLYGTAIQKVLRVKIAPKSYIHLGLQESKINMFKAGLFPYKRIKKYKHDVEEIDARYLCMAHTPHPT